MFPAFPPSTAMPHLVFRVPSAGPWRRGGVPVALLLLATFVLTGCRSFVFAPDPDGPFAPTDEDDRATVFVIEEGVHTGLVLPHPEAGLMEYGYGDWGWYAEGHAGVLQAIPTMLWETQGTVGRRSLAVDGVDLPDDPAAWYRKWNFEVRLSPLVVSKRRARALQQRLDAMIDGVDESDRRENRAWKMTFARCDRGFWLGSNCNDAVADWLRELGCHVTPALFRLGVQVAGPRPNDVVTRKDGLAPVDD